MSARDERRAARRARLSTAAQVALAGALALAATVLVTWLAERPGLRVRRDLTASGDNTLDEQTLRVVRALPVDARADVFFSAPEPPFVQPGFEVQARTLRLLRLVSDQSGGRLVLVQHDLSDRSKISAETQARRVELGLSAIEPGGVVVVSAGGRRETLRLRGDLADMDPGNSDPRQGPLQPATVVNYRGEEALLRALLKVSVTDVPTIVFTTGHGEIDTRSVTERGARGLATELEADGFRLATWDGSRGAALPAQCDVVAVRGPEQRFTESEIAILRAFVESGGRLLAALGRNELEGADSLEGLLGALGVVVTPGGIVCTPSPDVTGQFETGKSTCAIVAVGFEGMPVQNPILEPLRVAGRRVYVYASRALQRGSLPPGASMIDLLRAGPDAWLETPIPGTRDRYDWMPANDSPRGRFTLAASVVFTPLRPVPPERSGAQTGVRPECRLVVLGSADALANQLVASNRDFAVNAFDWLGSRAYRVHVESRNREARRLDLAAEGSVERVHRIAVYALPGLCLVLWAFTAWRRRRT